MTTLPSTTPMRLPRPMGAGPLGFPGGMSPAAPAPSQMTGADAWRVIRTNLWWILIVMLLSVGAGFGIYVLLMRFFVSYTAMGLCVINPPRNYNMLDKSIQASQDVNTLSYDLRTQANELMQESLFVQVLQDPDSEIRKTSWYQGFQQQDNVLRAKEDLKKHLDAEVVPESRLISVTMSGSDAHSCRVIVESIINQHLENQTQIQRNEEAIKTKMLNGLKQSFTFAKDALVNQLRDKAANLASDGIGTSGRLSVKDQELQNLIKTRFEVQHDHDEAFGEYQSAVNQLNQGQDLPGAQDELMRDPDVATNRQLLSQAEYQLSQLGSLGSKSNMVINLKKSIAEYQKKLDDSIARVRAQANASIVDKLKQMSDITAGQVKSITDQVTSAQADLSDLTNSLNEYLTMKDQLQDMNDVLKNVNDQLAQLTQVSIADTSTIQWAVHPITPDLPSFPKLPWVLTATIGGALALSLGIAFALELMDTTVRSPRDIARVGQLNLLGIIPHEDEDPQSAGASLPTVIFQAPQSMLAEQFRQVRSRLQHAASLDSTRSIMITSPSPGDGKTTVACNLAAGLALNGRRILLVDANFRRPELHKIYSAPNDLGFSAVLGNIDNFSAAICQTQVPNLDILPTGQRPANATELIESQLLIDFIERALEEYDHVIFDSGPFLFVSESVALAPRVDGVITVVRARTNSRGLLQRLRDDLRKTKAEHLGVVLNGVRAQAGGYYTRNIKTYYAYQNGHDEST